MANYIINECLTNDVYVLSSSTILISGATIGFLIGEEEVHCGTVGVVTDSPETPTISFISYDTDCCTCLTNNGVLLNFYFKRCDTLDYVCIEGTDFCNSFGLPTTGLTYEIQYESDAPFCATFEGLCSAGVIGYDWVSGPHLIECECGEEPPRSAGTEYEICEICCDCGTTGSTVNLITPPHPVYTDGYGTPVTQLNMVTLGGPNGLNS